MSHKLKQLENCKRFLSLEVSKEETAAAYQEVYKQIQKEAVIPGFRKGKAPRNLIESDYKDFARKKVVELLVENSYKEAIKQAGVFPIGLPKIENLKFPEGGNLSFEAIVEIRPKIEPRNYKGLVIKKKAAEVKDDALDAALEDLRQMGARYKTVQPRPVQEGDFILCNLEWFVENKSVDRKESVLLGIEKKALTKDVLDGLLGCNAGEKKSISINIDEGFHKPGYAGKSGILEVFIHQVKEKELPSLDDAFAKNLGVSEGMGKLRENIMARLIQQKQQAAYLDMQDQIVGQLLKSHSFQLPASLVESELRNLIEDSRQRLLGRGCSEKEAADIINKDKDGLLKKLKPHAENQVKIFFIFEEIAVKENLTATQEQLTQLIDTLAKKHNQPAEKFKKQLETDDKLSGLYWQLTEAKVMEFLIENAKVEAISV